MNIHWHIPGVDLGPGTKEYGERRIHFALGRFAQRISRLDLHVKDENGPKGSMEKTCRVIARISPLGVIAIQVCDSDLHVLLDRAVDRLSRSVRRELERRRQMRKARVGAEY